MAAKAGDWAYDTVYGPFLALGGVEGNGRSANNPGAMREALIERMYRRILTEMAMNRFKWTGMPDSIDLRYLELTLFRYALSVFYFDTKYNRHLALQGAGAGQPNFYQNPTSFLINGNGSFMGKTLKARHVVPIWANYMRTPDIDIVMIYAKKLAEIDRTLEINSKKLRTPTILAASENTKLSVENIMRQIDEGTSVITVNTDGPMGDPAAIQQVIFPMDMGVDPDAVEKAHIYRTRIWGECMGLLGLDFANQDKKERLVAAEVGANDKQVDAIRRVNLNAREQACEQINKKFGLSVSVEYHTEENTLFETTDGDETPPAVTE
jgi:hypothetical protein